MEKLFFYDLETTGVKYWKNGIHQISGCIMIDNEIKEKFNFKVKPYEKAIIEDDALKSRWSYKRINIKIFRNAFCL